MECLWRRKNFLKRGGGRGTNKKKMGGSSISHQRYKWEGNHQRIYQRPLLIFLFCSFFSFFFVRLWEMRFQERMGGSYRLSYTTNEKRVSMRNKIKYQPPPHPQKNKIQHSFSYFLSCYYCFVMMEERPMVDKQGARHRSASARHSGPYSAKSENRI